MEKLIYIGIYEHKHGTDARVFSTEDEVMAWRDDIAEEFWDEEFDDVKRPGENIGERYFELMGECSGRSEYFTVKTDTIAESAIEVAVRTIDWKLLGEQKAYCLNEAANDRVVGQIYDGLINMIDAIQDAAVKDEIATKEEVFPDLEVES